MPIYAHDFQTPDPSPCLFISVAHNLAAGGVQYLGARAALQRWFLGRGAELDLLVDRWFVCCRRFLLAGLYNTPPARAGAGSPSSAAGEHEQRRRGEQEGRMNEKGSERIGGAEFILCLFGGTLGDSLFFPFPYLFEIWQTIAVFVWLVSQPASSIVLSY